MEKKGRYRYACSGRPGGGVGVAALPSGWAENLSGIVLFLEVANAWPPLTYGFTLLLLYYSYLLGFVVVKQVRALIPPIN